MAKAFWMSEARLMLDKRLICKNVIEMEIIIPIGIDYFPTLDKCNSDAL